MRFILCAIFSTSFDAKSKPLRPFKDYMIALTKFGKSLEILNYFPQLIVLYYLHFIRFCCHSVTIIYILKWMRRLQQRSHQASARHFTENPIHSRKFFIAQFVAFSLTFPVIPLFLIAFYCVSRKFTVMNLGGKFKVKYFFSSSNTKANEFSLATP